MTWVEGATHTYVVALAIGLGLLLAGVGWVERRARRSRTSHWNPPGMQR